MEWGLSEKLAYRRSGVPPGKGAGNLDGPREALQLGLGGCGEENRRHNLSDSTSLANTECVFLKVHLLQDNSEMGSLLLFSK